MRNLITEPTDSFPSAEPTQADWNEAMDWFDECDRRDESRQWDEANRELSTIGQIDPDCYEALERMPF